MRRAEALRMIDELDRLAGEANSHWHSLERIKRSIAEEHNISNQELHERGVYVPDIDGR